MHGQTIAARTATQQPARPAMVMLRARAGRSMEMVGAPMPFSRNAEIYGENEPAEYLYKVISGAVRTYKVLSDGRRQIGGFYLPGDIFGLECGDEHSFSAEAISECSVLVIKRSTLVSLAARDGDVARQLWTMTANELQRAQDHVMLLIKTAQERVAGFLLEMAARGASARRDRTADVAPGHCRLSGPHHRDRVAHADAAREIAGDRGAGFAPHRAAQPRRAQPHERLIWSLRPNLVPP